MLTADASADTKQNPIARVLLPGLPGFGDDDIVKSDVIEQAHKRSPRTVWGWMHAPNGLPYMPIGNDRLIRVGSYRKWLLEREVKPGSGSRKRRAA